MITTTDAPAWLRRSDQAVSWARTMLQRDHAVVIDCETTDLPGGVCEVAVVDTCGRILLNSLVNPKQPISPAANKVHNITDQMVAGAPTFPDVFAEILRVTASRRVLAYNAAFDSACLLADSQRHGRDPEHLDDPDTWGCIMRARSAWVGTPDHFYPLGAAHRRRRRCNRSFNRVADNCHRLRTPYMTARAPVPAVGTPISGSPKVTSLQCLTISCAACDLAAWGDYVVHFDSEHDLWEWISGEGWTVRRDNTVLCPTHSADADCTENGHAWDDWYALTSDPETEYRYCEHCSAGEERRIGRQRHPCPSSGSTRVHPTQA